MSPYTLTPEEERTLAMMKAADADADRELEKRLEAMTEEERAGYLERMAEMSARITSSTPQKEE
jgi:hypothetical protein